MITYLGKRKERERKILSGHSVGDERVVSDTELFGQLGNKIKVTKK